METMLREGTDAGLTSSVVQQHKAPEQAGASMNEPAASEDLTSKESSEQEGAEAKPRPRGRILVVDDETNARNALAELLRDEGYTVETAPDGFKALPKLEEFAPDLLLTDLKMPGMDGIGLMRKAQEADSEVVSVVMTAYGAVDTAVSAMRAGAADYITKPINFEELSIVLERALERRRLRAEAGQLRQRLCQRDRIENIVGASPPMARVFETILQVAPSRASVLITGESGTGKELVAAAIHQHSARASGPFVKLHCAALAETLLESELFGHEKGAFTGAMGRRDGRFQQADGGTLFLDEIGEISPAIQVKLLRFLQQREFERVGGNQTIKVDVRIVAATHRDLSAEVRAGHFREDLFYRLNVVTIEMPPLRSRVSDIPLLATRFLQRFAEENGKDVRGFSDEALQRLTQYSWPGNVRELENAVERAVVVCRHHEVRAQDLSPHIVKTTARAEDGLPVVPGASLAELERYAILKTLEHTGGSTSRAAEILGISPRTIQYRLHEYADARITTAGNKRAKAQAQAAQASQSQNPNPSQTS
jgi:DNA-binding NtrC family response regulator